MDPARRTSAAALALVLLAASPWVAPAAHAQEEAAADGPASWLERRVQQAETGQFYLVLDPVEASLALALGGVTLLELPVSEVAVLAPRVLFRRADLPAGWQDATWTHGTLDPPLPVTAIVPPPSGEVEAAVAPPPLPDDLVPAPDVYDIRFAGGLALRVVAAGEGTPRGAGLAAAARERWRVLRGAAPDAVRVQVLMAPDDAARLYRALPPDTSLVLAPLDAAPQEP